MGTYNLATILVLLDIGLAFGSGDECNVTDQYCHNCQYDSPDDDELSLDACKEDAVLDSQETKDLSECVTECQGQKQCLGVHYDGDSSVCTHLIKCTYLFSGGSGQLYRKSCNKDCSHFTLNVIDDFQPDCDDIIQETNVTKRECLLACADTGGCRQVTHDGTTCFLHFCTNTVLSTDTFPGFFKNCFTTTSTASSQTTTSATNNSKTSTPSTPTPGYVAKSASTASFTKKITDGTATTCGYSRGNDTKLPVITYLLCSVLIFAI